MGKVFSAFTVKAIEMAKDVTLTEQISRGLRLVAGKSARTWVYRYDWEARQRQVTLGSWPTMGIAEARRRFAELKAGRKSGVDPAAVKGGLKLPPTERATVEELCESFITEHVEKSRNSKSAAEARRLIAKRVIPVLGGRIAETITVPDAVSFLTGVRNESLAAARVLRGELRGVWRHALEAGRVTGSNPFSDIMKGRLPQIRRKRYLDDSELRQWFSWLPNSRISSDLQDALQMILHTACRPGEVIGLSWSAVDLRSGVLTLHQTKADAPRTVVLPNAAIDILQRRRHGAEVGAEWVFPSPLPGHHMRQHALVWAVSKYRHEVLIPEWTSHDLRRTARTGMARLGIPDAVGEAALGHIKGGVAGTYDLHRYQAEVGEALALWSRHLDALQTNNVVALRGGK